MNPKNTENAQLKKTEKEKPKKTYYVSNRELIETLKRSGMPEEREERPPFCFDKSCQLLLSVYDKKSFDEGYSFFCFGKLAKTQVFKEREILHENNISHCYYTPLKGMLRFFMNEDDLWGEAWAKVRVLNKLKEIKCGKCGGVVRKRIVNTCLDCCGGG
jgi:uncharacterized protein YwqG